MLVIINYSGCGGCLCVLGVFWLVFLVSLVVLSAGCTGFMNNSDDSELDLDNFSVIYPSSWDKGVADQVGGILDQFLPEDVDRIEIDETENNITINVYIPSEGGVNDEVESGVSTMTSMLNPILPNKEIVFNVKTK